MQNIVIFTDSHTIAAFLSFQSGGRIDAEYLDSVMESKLREEVLALLQSKLFVSREVFHETGKISLVVQPVTVSEEDLYIEAVMERFRLLGFRAFMFESTLRPYFLLVNNPAVAVEDRRKAVSVLVNLSERSSEELQATLSDLQELTAKITDNRTQWTAALQEKIAEILKIRKIQKHISSGE